MIILFQTSNTCKKNLIKTIRAITILLIILFYPIIKTPSYFSLSPFYLLNLTLPTQIFGQLRSLDLLTQLTQGYKPITSRFVQQEQMKLFEQHLKKFSIRSESHPNRVPSVHPHNFIKIYFFLETFISLKCKNDRRNNSYTLINDLYRN